MEIVTAVYEVCSEFVVPKGIDLKSANWWIKWDTMYIETEDGRKIEVEPRYRASETDWKRPDKTEITMEDKECDDCECPFQPKGEEEVCPKCDAVAKELPHEECEGCGKVLVCATEEEFDEHPDRDGGYDEDGEWRCKECRRVE
jgi:hypothetical protein